MKKLLFSILFSSVAGVQAQNLYFTSSPTVTFDASTNNITIALHYGNEDPNINVGTFKIGVYLSANTTINTSDFRVKTFSQNQSSAGVTGTLNIPVFDLDDFIGSLSNGTYYIGAILDYENQASEYNENDNTTYKFTPITVTLWNGTLTTPVLTSPANIANQIPTSTSLKWNESNEADSYDWQLYEGTTLKQSGNVAALSVNVTVASSISYKWRVRAKKGTTTTAYSGYFEFLSIIPAPSIYLPTNGATNVSLTPKFVWSKNPAATAYKYYVTNTSGAMVTSGSVADTTATLPAVNTLSPNTKYYWHARAWIGSVEGSKPSSFAYSFTTTSSTGVDDVPEVPLTNLLEQNYPNPFNPSTEIQYQLSGSNHVMLKIYDAMGREVATLVNEVKEAGYYSATFNGSNLASGIYFATLQSGEKVQMKKMLMLK